MFEANIESIAIAAALIGVALAIYFCLFHGYNKSNDWTVEEDEAVSAALDAQDELARLVDLHGAQHIVSQLAHLARA